MGNPAAGVLVLLAALYLLLAYFAGRLEWLFTLGPQVRTFAGGYPKSMATPEQRDALRDLVIPARPTTTGAA